MAHSAFNGAAIVEFLFGLRVLHYPLRGSTPGTPRVQKQRRTKSAGVQYKIEYYCTIFRATRMDIAITSAVTE